MVSVSQALLLVEVSVTPLSLFIHRSNWSINRMCVPGYSWKTNQYGLTIDSVTEFHLVSPNGTQMIVTERDENLWFALKVCLI